MKRIFVLLFVFVCVISCQEEITEQVPLNDHQTDPDPPDDPDPDDDEDLAIGEDNSNLMLGNPSDAEHDIADENNYLMVKDYYVLSYNRSRAIANWVSWYVGPTWLGDAERSDAYGPDSELPASWFHVTDGSYTGSGFSRGHNCPSADRTSSDAANEATFLMTNMIPQVQENNGGVWENLEAYIRTKVNSGSEAFVIMGNYGVGGTDTNNVYKESIAGGAIAVPKFIWKVVVIIPQGNGDLGRITNATRVIAVNTPNSKTISGSWGSFRVSVDAIETATGLDLLSILPDDVEVAVEARVDNESI